MHCAEMRAVLATFCLLWLQSHLRDSTLPALFAGMDEQQSFHKGAIGESFNKITYIRYGRPVICQRVPEKRQWLDAEADSEGHERDGGSKLRARRRMPGCQGSDGNGGATARARGP